MIALGVNVPNFGPEADRESLLGWAEFAEHRGFSILVVSDHVAPTREVTDVYPPPIYDPFVLLAWLAARTARVRLGTSVTVLPYRHPLLTARMSAMIHEFSEGRFVLGVGSGWAESEFRALGLGPADRGAATDAALGVVTRAWQAGRLDTAAIGLPGDVVATGPVPAPGGVPVWVGGSGRPAIRRAARFADAWHPINPRLEWLRDVGLPALRIAADEVGRPVPALVPRIKARLQPEPAGAGRPLGVGTVDQVAADVAALEALGAAEVILDPNPDRPVPRDAVAEQRQLVEVMDAVGTVRLDR